jgi:hypothetical protein
MQINRLDPIAPTTSRLVGALGDPGLDLVAAQASVAGRERFAWAPAATPVPTTLAVASSGPARGSAQAAADPVALAKLAQDVYLDAAAPPAGYRVATNAELARIGVNPTLLAQRSDGYSARAYISGTGKTAQVVIAFRGSVERGDWVANIRQSVGLNTNHYKRALEVGRQVAQSGATNVTFTGHSLGGGLASAAGLAAGSRTATFNAAGLSDATINQANAIRNASGRTTPDIRAYFVRGEILSALQDGGDRVVGGLIGGYLGSRADAPEAYGTRVQLDAVLPSGKRFWNNNALDKHGMDWVLSGLRAR